MLSLSSFKTCSLSSFLLSKIRPNRLQVLQNKFSLTRLFRTYSSNDFSKFWGIVFGVYGSLKENKTLSILTTWAIFLSSLLTKGLILIAILSNNCIHFVKFLLDSYLSLPRISKPLKMIVVLKFSQFAINLSNIAYANSIDFSSVSREALARRERRFSIYPSKLCAYLGYPSISFFKNMTLSFLIR